MEGPNGPITMSMDPDIVDKMNSLTKIVEDGKRVDDLSRAELFELRDTIRAVKTCIETANQLLGNEKYKTIAEAGKSTKTFLSGKKKYKKLWGPLDTLKQLTKSKMLDAATRFHTFGEAGESIYKEMRDGFNTKVTMLQKSAEQMETLKKKVGVTDKEIRQWNKDTITDNDHTFTVQEVMELYLLGKRKQASEHMEKGGVELEPVKKGLYYEKQELVKLPPLAINRITSKLTDKQKAFADGVQKLYAEAAKWGNEASMKQYGYAKFNDPNYVPIESVKDYFATTTDGLEKADGTQAIKNMGPGKATVDHANTPIMLRGIIDVYVDHTNQMSSYAAFLTPLSDMQKWMNYMPEELGTRVKQDIADVYGQDASRYVTNLMQTVNGSAKQDRYFGKELVSAFKGSAVGLNLSVVIQQPTAYVRALAEIDPKYLMGAFRRKSSADWETIKKYSKIAQWKDWGFFETDVGKSMQSILTGHNTLKDALNEKQMWAAGKGDEIAWSQLWNAAELQVSDTTQLKKGTDEYYRAVAEIFDNIIDKTQVVDSPFHRTEIMRSKNDLTQMVTSFMSEPMKSYNMLYRAAFDMANAKTDEQKKAASRKIAMSAAAFLLSNAAAAAAKSVVTALRDKDKDKEYWDRYGEKFSEELLDNVKPWNYLPLIKDITSIFEGYSPTRTDLSAFQELYYAFSGWKKLLTDENASANTFMKNVMNTLKPVSAITGIAVDNLYRDFEGIFDEMVAIIGADEVAYNKKKIMDKNIKATANSREYISMALKAYYKGNTKLGDKIIKDMLEAGIDEKKLDEKAKSIMKDDPELAKAVYSSGGGAKILAAEAMMNATKESEKNADKVKAIEKLDISEEDKGILYEATIQTEPSKTYQIWKDMGGNPYSFMKLDQKVNWSDTTMNKLKARNISPETIEKYVNGKKIRKEDVPDRGFASYKKLTDAENGIGKADINEDWHHIVEQEQGKDKGGRFDSKQINNSRNIVSVQGGTNSIHTLITYYYGSKQSFTGGKTVSEWLKTKSFDEQWEFGVNYLQKYGTLIPSDECWFFIPNDESGESIKTELEQYRKEKKEKEEKKKKKTKPKYLPGPKNK